MNVLLNQINIYLKTCVPLSLFMSHVMGTQRLRVFPVYKYIRLSKPSYTIIIIDCIVKFYSEYILLALRIKNIIEMIRTSSQS